jgi:uncharacterized protein
MSAWSDATLLRILVSDDDTDSDRPLYEAIVASAHDAQLAGVTVTRGITGYGRSGHVHEVWRAFSYDLPIVIEIIDSEPKIDAWLPALERLRQGALVSRQHVQILQPHG